MSLEDVEKWDDLEDVPIPKLQDERVEILIGQDSPEVLMPLKMRMYDSSVKLAPFAVRTLLGWIINGPIGGHGEKDVVALFLSTMNTLEDQVERFWKIEGAHMSESMGLSLEDKKALEIVQATTRKEKGHCSATIPFETTRSCQTRFLQSVDSEV